MFRIFVLFLISLLINLILTQSEEKSVLGLNLEDVLRKLNLNKFLQSLRNAQMQDLLYTTDRMTIFAPNDLAFQNGNLPIKEDVNQMINYHVSDSWFHPQSTTWQNEQLLPTWLSGNSLRLNTYPDSTNNKVTTVNGAKIIHSDESLPNIRLHVLDKMLQPSYNIYDTVRQNRDSSAFLNQLLAANVVRKLKYDEPMTLFVPIDSAIGHLPQSFNENLMSDLPAMTAIVYHHMCNGTHYFPDGFVDRKLKSIEGSELNFKSKDIKSSKDFGPTINDHAKILATYPATNGVVHFIDKMLIPKGSPKQIMYSFKDQVLPSYRRR